MKSYNLKKISQMKKGHGWLSLVMYLLIFAVTAGILSYSFIMLGYYLIQAKLAAEYESIAYMAKIYEENPEADDETIRRILESSDKEYIVRDKFGDDIVGKSDNTCDESLRLVNLSGIDSSVYLYTDTKYPYISGTRYGYLDVDLAGLYGKLNGMDEKNFDPEIVTLSSAEDEEDLFNNPVFFMIPGSDFLVRLPVWMGVPLGNENIFIGKGYLSFNMGDLSILIFVVIMLTVLFIIIFAAFVINMIEGIRARKKALRMLFMDIVTGGKNRTWFFFKADKILRGYTNRSYNYAIVNLVFVKYTTYCVCHSVSEGEAVLRGISDCIGKHLTRKEIHAHGSPKEFMMLLRAGDTDQLTARLQNLISDLERINTEHAFTYQVGVAMLPVERDANGKIIRRKNVDSEEEYNNACTARGTLGDKEDSGIAYFDLKLVEEKKWQDQVEECCRTALQNQEFKVYYQAKYDPDTKELRGAEALVRWDSPTLGFVSPGRFIPIFEKNGFIVNIDHYMLSHVAQDQKRWLDEGLSPVPVSVNISRAHFIEADLAEQIRDTVDSTGAPRNLVEIELTESAFFDDKNALIRTIDKLREYGFAVSMDDFGSGYSSLNSLKDMPLDVLKIDAEFFRGENAGERGRIVVAETIKLARKLNMRTVAEGVEKDEQVEFLKDQGCDMIQGFIFARPEPSDKYVEMMKNPTVQKTDNS